MKLDSGLDRSINAIVGWVKIYLQSEQKKTDFKPDTDNMDTLASPVSKLEESEPCDCHLMI